MEVLNMDIIDELRAIENIYEVEIDGVWYVDMSDLSDEDKIKVEKLTDNTIYSDEYYTCDCCGKAHFINDGYTQLDDVLLCPECMRKLSEDTYYFDEYIDRLINNPKNADKYLSDKILKSIGFKKISHVYRIGLHEGDNDAPEKILKEYQKFDVIFKILEQNPFEIEYCVYIR